MRLPAVVPAIEARPPRWHAVGSHWPGDHGRPDKQKPLPDLVSGTREGPREPQGTTGVARRPSRPIPASEGTL